MASTPPFHIVIEGAGPAGLLTALTITKSAKESDFIKITLLEKRSQDRYFADVGGGYDLGMSVTETMKELGIHDEYIAGTFYTPNFTILNSEGKEIRTLPIDRKLGWRSARRSSLQRVLLTAVGEESIRFATAVSSIEYRSANMSTALPSPVRVNLENGEPIDCDLVVGCGGISSPVRSSILTPEQCKPNELDYVCYWGTLEPEHVISLLAPPCAADGADDTGNTPFMPYVGTTPQTTGLAFGDAVESIVGRACWIFGDEASMGAAILTDAEKENAWVVMKRKPTAEQDEVRKEQQKLGKEERLDLVKEEAIAYVNTDMSGYIPLVALIEATPAERIAKIPLLDHNPVDTWHSKDNRGVLCGDSAHACTPFIGQGATMSLADGYVLGTLILKAVRAYRAAVGSGKDEDRLTNILGQILTKYEDIRLAETNANVLSSRTYGEWTVTDSWFKSLVTTTLLRFVPGDWVMADFTKFDTTNRAGAAAARDFQLGEGATETVKR
eukprot:TRINITY_DN9616_c0_g1_i1.p1 TRINITY_DN9616_c0_g1~~TRINITY_DN9616_c0_g1_i1.p1  ORF type:complete len:539 (+),score=96.62 TRINITY_DN9616_c0_g1_i1:121-1617(+)